MCRLLPMVTCIDIAKAVRESVAVIPSESVVEPAR